MNSLRFGMVMQMAASLFLATACRSNLAVIEPYKGDPIKVGSNFVMNDLGDLLSDPTSWFGGGGKKGVEPLVGTFHEHPERNTENLRRLSRSGQRIISLMIWHLRVPSSSTGVYGHTVDSSLATLRPQHRSNLIQILSELRSLGFEKVIVRFAPQGGNLPSEWSSWDEDIYQENWNFITSVRSIVLENKGKMDAEFDLGVELGGIRAGQAEPYVRRLYQDYFASFTPKDTYGFSIAWDGHGWVDSIDGRGRIVSYLSNLGVIGVSPSKLALDVYGSEAQAMVEARRSIEQANLPVDLPVIIQEAYLDDEIAAEAVFGAINEKLLNVVAVYQWPAARGGTSHFTTAVPDAILKYQAPYIASVDAACSDRPCVRIHGLQFPKDCSVAIYEEGWQAGDRPLATLASVACRSQSLITTKLPAQIVESRAALSFVVVDSRLGARSKPVVYRLRE